MPKLQSLILLLLFPLLSFPKPAFAQHFTSTNYTIDWGNFNMTSGQKTSTSYSLTDTVGQNAPGLSTNSTLKVKAGFQYIYDTFNQLSFAINLLTINLGSLVAGVGSTGSNTLTLTTPSGRGYQIIASQNHPLQNLTGQTIADTLCDSGLCSESSSGLWTNPGTYGFGLNTVGLNDSGVATGVGTSDYFLTANHYRQFADQSLGELPQIIMSESSPVKNRSATVTYKANISAIQPAGNFQNAITFTLVPIY